MTTRRAKIRPDHIRSDPNYRGRAERDRKKYHRPTEKKPNNDHTNNPR